MGDPITDRANRHAPNALSARRVRVQPNQRAALTVPGDPKLADGDIITRYFANLPDLTGKNQACSGANLTEFLIGGPESFKRIVDDIRLTQGSSDFIYLAGWWFDDSFALVPGDPTTTMTALLAAADARGVQIRALFYLNPLDDQAKQSDRKLRINALAGGFCILDQHVPVYGAHHQKLQLIYHSGQLHAYCGGIDINQDRLYGPNLPFSPGSPLHDVHCRLQGVSADALLTTFLQRWTDHPDAKNPLAVAKGALRGQSAPSSGPMTPAGRECVNIGRTFPNGQNHPLLGPPPTFQSFVPQGEQSARQMILNAISTAKNFVYIEDQYLFGADAGDAIVAALNNGVAHVTALLTWPEFLLPLMYTYRLRNCIQYARATGGRRLRICVRKAQPPSSPSATAGTYIHAKVVIVDDTFASIGSVNLNRRSFTYDTETVAGIVDQHTGADITMNLARRLRIALWARHLGMDNDAGYAELADGVASAVHWLDNRPESNAMGFNEQTPPNYDMSLLDAILTEYGAVAAVTYSLAGQYLPGLQPGVKAMQALLASNDPRILNSGIFDNIIDPDGS